VILVLDTSNLLHVTGVLDPAIAGWGLEELIAALAATLGASQRAVLVCDGPPPAARPPAHERIELVHSGKGRSADDLIARIASAAPDPRRLLVVSSDRAVQRAARRRRCRTLGSPEFLRQLAARLEAVRRARPQARRPSGPLEPGEISEWTRLFGDGLDEDPCDTDRLEDLLRRAGALDRGPAPPGPPTPAPPAATTPSSPPVPAPARPRRAGRRPPRPRAVDQGPPFPEDVLNQARRLSEEDEDDA
jgi:hypothetical protein